ncbi:ABC transporter permease protein [Indibacter alkaliphilus LW1]|uniref:ABC transporter permease protein n=1 Tax=Indibacter alkaliphilus (strain CCUG 57479 / KCTC 22604 / LW1) TaxID=1189612 RepID=S2D499_INDAL|nr:ABC transporter permease [Indibacter alkaliphilus]EOZ93754.1 ABC transporter permease protein [Indibacter alkaliphilus LW1]
MKTTFYSPQNKNLLSRLVQEIFLGFKEGRELAYRLFIRDLKGGYKKSFLGIVWLFIPPLFTAGIWIFLNGQNVVSIQGAPMDYAAFTLCGTILWSFFAEALNKPIQRYQGAMSMMSKLNFPREALILASIYDQLFSLLLKLLVLVPILWILGYPPSGTWIFGLIGILGLLITGISIGLMMAPLGLLYNDIGKALPLILPFAMYLSPVIYPLREGGNFLKLQALNPVTPFLEFSRSSLGGYSFNLSHELILWSGVVVFLFFFSLLLVKIAMPIIVERNGS